MASRSNRETGVESFAMNTETKTCDRIPRTPRNPGEASAPAIALRIPAPLCRCITLLIAAFALCVPLFAEEAGRLVIQADTLISGNYTIPPGVTCVIKQGVRISFSGYHRFLVQGTLIAEGTADAPIRFITENLPSPGNAKPAWIGLEIVEKGAVATLRHCQFRNAYRILVWESNPSFDSCEFTNNHYGMYCAKRAKPVIQRCQFAQNVYGVAIDQSLPLMLDNTISGNTVGVLLLMSPKTIIGRNVIANNETNIKTEEAFGAARGTPTLQYLWGIVNQLY